MLGIRESERNGGKSETEVNPGRKSGKLKINAERERVAAGAECLGRGILLRPQEGVGLGSVRKGDRQ